MKSYDSKLERDGFLGTLYVPDRSAFPGKALIVVGGGDGQFSFTREAAQLFAGKGIPALALRYWNGPGLPREFTHIPLEYARKAAEFLHSRGFAKVGMWGISAGAEYTLVCGSHYPDLLSALVAVSPSSGVIQGFQFINRYHLLPRPIAASPFTKDGIPLPYVPTVDRHEECISKSIEKKTVYFKPGYRDNFRNASEENTIPVENCRGPMLLLAADEDDMWDSRRSCEEILRRLQEKQSPVKPEFYHYLWGSHVLFPVTSGSERIFALSRNHPVQYRQACEDSFRKTLEFLRKW